MTGTLPRRWLASSAATIWASLPGIAVAVAALVTIAAFSSDADAAPIAALIATGAELPNWAVAAPGDTNRLFVLEQLTGRIRILDLATRQYKPTPFLTVTGVTTGWEAGLLCMAFHPLYPDSPYVYVYYTRLDSTEVIERYTVSSNPDLALAGSGTVILNFTTPTTYHTGGWLTFGTDGYLYISVGDGGGSGDSGPGHDPLVGNAQCDTTRHGKILRIDVDGAFPYSIPELNPKKGEPPPQDEILAKGLRNPWRCSFDRGTGDLYIADVGQGSLEEIDFLPSSSLSVLNYGWRVMEGFYPYNCGEACDSSGMSPPVLVYPHGTAEMHCAVVGGFVYRGQMLPELQGHYFFADYCSGYIWSLRVVSGQATDVRDRSPEIRRGPGVNIQSIVSFAEDARGELYIVTHDPVGSIYKIVPEATLLEAPVFESRASPMLGPAIPNPSGGPLSFSVEVPATVPVRLRVYDVRGRLVRTLVDEPHGPLERVVVWDARDDRGDRAPAGLYFLQLRAGSETRSKKVAVGR